MKGYINGQINGMMQNKRQRKYGKSAGKMNTNRGMLPQIKEDDAEMMLTDEDHLSPKVQPAVYSPNTNTDQL